MKIFIITEGGKDIGIGHITRCISIHQAFEERGLKSIFIIHGEDSVESLLNKKKYEIFNWLDDTEKLFNIIKDADIVVIDSYLADVSLYKEISTLVKYPVYIDDNKRINYPRGMVVNGSINAEKYDYPIDKEIFYLLGPRYISLRKEFWEVPAKKIRDEIACIMITFGGSDTRNLTPKVLKLLVERHPEFEKNVIIGNGFKNVKEIEEIRDRETNLFYYPNAEDMKNIMLKSDIAISAGGQTTYELARVGVPTIAIVVANNQVYSVSHWHKVGFIEYAGCWDNYETFNNVKRDLKLLEDVSLRKKMARTGKAIVDGKGARRLVEEIIRK